MEFLSPVSKLERARQMARMEQRRRIEAACEKKVNQKKVNSLKRKQVGKRLESHIKKKIKNSNESSPERTKPSPRRTVAAVSPRIGRQSCYSFSQ